MMKLYLGHKAYSSWSLRPWIAMRAHDVPFEEEVIPFPDTMGTDACDGVPAIRAVSPTGKVPVLHHDGLIVPDSLAILEYVAELHPDRPFWPVDARQRALARAVSAEMHSGFQALREHCPMNMRRAPRRKEAPEEVMRAILRDVRRVDTIWREALEASGGPFLFGAEFGIADAMFAPVVNRLHAYDLPRSDTAQRYMEAVMALPAWREWEAAARAEPWRITAFENA